MGQGGVREASAASTRPSARKLREAKRARSRRWTRCSAKQQEWATKFLAAEKYAGKVGAFEGASYEAKGLYRPEADCIMFTRDEVGFCRVCTRAIERMIDLYARP